jgi:hypothetical protein
LVGIELDQRTVSPIALFFWWFGFLGNSNVPHPLPNFGNGRDGHHLVKLPSRRFLSEAGASTTGNGWFRTLDTIDQNA